MIDFRWIIIIFLVSLSFYQFQNPTKSANMLDPYYGIVTEKIDGFNLPSLGGSTEEEPISSCPDIDNPVCGNGVTYKNVCEAALKDVLQVTYGAC